jgi:hypothetical protein
MRRAPHPPYSPDLAPCDFYLFGDIKGLLAGSSFTDPDRLLFAVEEICEHIEKPGLERAFLNWMKRLRRCIETNGELVHNAYISR